MNAPRHADLPPLLEIVDKITAIVSSLEDGVVTDEANAELDALGLTIELKVEAYHLVRGRLVAESSVCSAEASRLLKRRDARDTARKQLEDRLVFALKLLGQRQIKTPLLTCYTQESHSVIVRSLEDLPAKYKVTEPASERADKKALLIALKLGEHVPGAELETSEGIRFK